MKGGKPSSSQKAKKEIPDPHRRRTKEAAILQAEAKKQTAIKEAEGQSEAILMLNKATADGLKMIKDAGADDSVIKLKSLEAFSKAADGQATKIIIPSEIQGACRPCTSVKGIYQRLKE